MRTYALFGRNFKILCLLGSLLLGETIIAYLVVGYNVPKYRSPLRAGASSLPEIPGRRLAIMTWIYLSVFDSIVFGLTLYKAITLSRQRVHSPILVTVLKDGALQQRIRLTFHLISCFAACLYYACVVWCRISTTSHLKQHYDLSVFVRHLFRSCKSSTPKPVATRE